MPDVRRQIFTPGEQYWVVQILKSLPYRPCPKFLGQFDYSQYKNWSRFDPFLVDMIRRLESLVPFQKFNTVFIQRYLDESFVQRHKDPLNNVGKTVIAIFGQFTGGVSDHNGSSYRADSGDVVIQNCTINGQQGEPHSVGRIMGERYAIILNTIL